MSPIIACRCPKTVENFCVHSLNGYYNGHIFHRVIKSFMIQTGDPTGKVIHYCALAVLLLSCVVLVLLVGSAL